ncbi:hypothetical protein FRC03_011352 [Tulasnella sp. 419]|nr:hypothetical protein FRC03_011352 [Tulasnella sp. 419]
MLNQKKKAQQAHAHGQMLPPLLPASAVPGEMLNSADDLFSFLDQGSSPDTDNTPPPELTCSYCLICIREAVSQTTPLLHDSPVVGSGEPTIEELLGAFMSPTTPFLQQPLTSPSQPSPYDPNSYLPTPRSVYSSIGPSPDIVNIPGTPNNYTSPALQLLEEVLPPDAPLFPEASPVSPAAYLPTKTIDPRELPFLAPPMSRNPSSQTSSSSSSTSPQVRFSQPIVSAPPKQSSSESPSGQSPQVHLRHTGYRKGVQSVDLVPFDAPIQPRSYITPSATSRKDLPPSVTKSYKKRGAEEAGLPETSELRDQDDLTQSLLEHVQSKRLANTLAARRSRARKLQTAREQEERIQQLTDEVELWKKRAEELEQMLRQGGMM